MSCDIKIPSVGESVLEVTIGEWTKKDGDIVEQNDVILVLETDKASVEITAEQSGVLRIITPKGNTVPVGSLVGTLEPASDEMISQAIADKKDNKKQEKAQNEVTRDSTKSDSQSAKQTSPSEASLKPSDLQLKDFPPSKRHAILNHPESVLEDQGRKKPAEPVVNKKERITRTPLSAIRRTIAHRLKEVQNTAAILTTFNEVDLTDVMALRQKYQEEFVSKYGVKLGLMSLFIKASIEGLKMYPLLNGAMDGDDLVYNHFYNIGVAVSTPRGLMVPVLRDVDHKGLADIELDIKHFSEKAREGKIAIDDLSGGTFTITNGGVFGSMLSTPILNPPQSGILGMHAINERPMAIDGQIQIRRMMYLALSYDHRIVDGREAVSFLVTVKKNLEDTRRLLLQL